MNSCTVFGWLVEDGEGDEISIDGLLTLEAVGFLGSSLTGTLSLLGTRPEGVGVVGRVLTRETGRCLSCCEGSTEPMVVENDDIGLKRTLAPFIRSCCIPLSNWGGNVLARNCSRGELKSEA